MMHRLQKWASARLWRQFVIGHLVVIISTILILQLILAGVVMLMTRSTHSIPSDAGIWAQAFAIPAGQIIQKGNAVELQTTLELVQTGSLSLPTFKGVQPGEWYGRLIAVRVITTTGETWAEIGESGVSETAVWDELITQIHHGETDPQQLSRWLPESREHILGVAPIQDANKIVGIVIVEMYPSLRPETSPSPLISFLGTILTTSVLGLPVLLLASLLALLSAVIVSRSLVQRLRQLQQTAQAMSNGDLSQRIADTADDEIGQLGQAFNSMQTQLEQSLATRRKLIANISHELRTPLATVSAHLETLEDYPARLETYLPVLQHETERLSNLVTDLFDLSRLDAKEMPLDLTTMALDEIITDVVKNYRTLAWEQRRIVLEAPPLSLPPVIADPQRVTQILVNLISNGLRHTPTGGIITIDAEADAAWITVRVIDTGPGIPAVELAHIFDRSYRGNYAHAAVQDGLHSSSGLGLSIVKGLVEAMQGEVTAVSKLEEGTSIIFRLPIAIPDPNTLNSTQQEF